MQHSVGRSSPQRTNSNSKTAAKPGASKLRSAPINRALLVPKPRQTLPRYRAPAASQVMVTPDHVKQAIEDEKRRVEEDRLRKKLDKEREVQSVTDTIIIIFFRTFFNHLFLFLFLLFFINGFSVT